MPTTIDRYLDTASSGGDGTTPATSGAAAAYADMADALAGIASDFPDFVTSDVLVRLHCTGGDDSWAANPTVWTSTTDSTRYLEIFFGGSYRLIQSNSFWRVMFFSTFKVVLHDLNLLHTGSRTNDAKGVDFSSGTGWYELDGGQIACTGSGTPSAAHQAVVCSGISSPTIIQRNLVLRGWGINNCANDGFGGGRTTVLDNCTLLDGTTGVTVRRNTSDTWIVRNCVAQNNSSADYSVLGSGGTFTHSGNLSGDATCVDAAGASATVTFVDAVAGDYHLDTAGTDADASGTDLSGDTYSFTTDRDGVTRSVPWSSGAYEARATFTVTVLGRDARFDAADSTMPSTVVDWHWEFGDGDESTGEQSDHTYLGQTTAFTVMLTTTDDLGNTASCTRSVSPGPAYYIATTGTSGGVGSAADPLSLTDVLVGTIVHDEVYHGFPPTETVTFWLVAGTYALDVSADREGTSTNPYFFRAIPGDHVIFNGRIGLTGSDMRFQGMEWYDSSPSTGAGLLFDCHCPRGQLLDAIVHDSGYSGVGLWNEATDAVVADCVIYNNGTHTNADHGVYFNGNSGSKYVRGNVVFNNWQYGLHNYSSVSGEVQGTVADGNICFLNGTIGPNLTGPDMFSGGSTCTDLSWTNNRGYRLDDGELVMTLGVGEAGNTGLIRTGNYLVGPVAIGTFGGTVDQSGNTEIDPGSPPTGIVVLVRASVDVLGVGQIAVYNWDDVATVDVDVSSILRRGDSYAIYEAQDILGSAVASGTWDGTSDITLPMDEVVVPDPIGRSFTTPPTTGTTFHAFVVRRTAQSYVAPPSTQVAYPVSDVSVSGWTTDTGATTGLAATLADQSDTTWIESTTEAGDVVEVQLDPLDWPEQGDVSVTLRHRGT